MEFFAQIKKPELILKPLYDSDLQEIVRLKQGTEYKFTVVHPRNYEFHKKYFALLRMGFQNQDKIKTEKEYRFLMTLKAGYFTIILTDKGKVFMPESISFASMDEIEFEKLYNATINVLCVELNTSVESIMQELVNFM